MYVMQSMFAVGGARFGRPGFSEFIWPVSLLMAMVLQSVSALAIMPAVVVVLDVTQTSLHHCFRTSTCITDLYSQPLRLTLVHSNVITVMQYY